MDSRNEHTYGHTQVQTQMPTDHRRMWAQTHRHSDAHGVLHTNVRQACKHKHTYTGIGVGHRCRHTWIWTYE
jgi:hypothetical protein